MNKVTVRELRNQGGRILQRVSAGESLTVTFDGEPIAELRPLQPKPLSADVLLGRWRRLPPVDAKVLREDVDSVMDHDPFHLR